MATEEKPRSSVPWLTHLCDIIRTVSIFGIFIVMIVMLIHLRWFFDSLKENGLLVKARNAVDSPLGMFILNTQAIPFRVEDN